VISDENLETSTSTPPTQIKRNVGVTEAERYLNSLCDKTFLSLWSYPGLYRDQKDGGSQGKELCDLLVVFGAHIIIFSDKDCTFKDTGNIEKDWKRWFKKGVVKSADQAWGAERWIREFPERLFLDKECTQPFPFDLPDMSKASFHLVLVAHNVSQKCAEVHGGSGSMMIQSAITGIENHYTPFTFGDLDPNRSFVHILDDTTLNIIMNTLDTISDFTAYLEKKELFIRSGRPHVIAAGEEELLANYLIKLNEMGEHDFDVPNNLDLITYDEGCWNHFQNHPIRIGQIKANEVSYRWDSLIEKSNEHALNNTHLYSIPSGIKTVEKIARILASESRLRRRILAERFLTLLRTTPVNQSMTRYTLSTRDDEPAYVFLIRPEPNSTQLERYREERRELLSANCRMLKLMYKHLRTIVGIATETGINNPIRSEDILLLEGGDWTQEDYKEAEQLQKETCILENVTPEHIHESEYPEIRKPSVVNNIQMSKKYPRNNPCHCGSGVKFKKCCGRN
jgi:hypothetical protein